MSKGIKEIGELIDGLTLIGEQAKKISKGNFKRSIQWIKRSWWRN